MSRAGPQIRRPRTHRRSVGEAAADSPVLPGAAHIPDTTVGAAEGSILPLEAGLKPGQRYRLAGGGQHGRTRGRVVLRLSGIVVFVGHGADDGEEKGGRLRRARRRAASRP